MTKVFNQAELTMYLKSIKIKNRLKIKTSFSKENVKDTSTGKGCQKD